MATLGEDLQAIQGIGGKTFDQSLSDVYADAPIRNQPNNDFSDMSEATRQLLAEGAATGIGDLSVLENDAVQRFIRGDFSGSSSGSGTGGGSRSGSGSGGGGGDVPTVEGEIVSDNVAGGDNSQALLDAIDARFGTLDGDRLTEDEFLLREQDNIQAQLDSLNALYDARVGRAEVEGKGRLGQTRALNAVSGNMFNPFGNAQTDQTTRYNEDIIAEINKERAAEISNLYAAARGEATRRYESQEDRLVETANLFIDSMVDAYNLSFEEEQAIRDGALQRAALTGYLDGDATLDQQSLDLSLRSYLTDVAFQADQNDRANRELDLRIEQARQQGFQVQTMADGTVGYWDFSGASPIFTPIGNYARVTSSGGGGSGSGGGYGGLNDPLVRDALNAYEYSGGSINNLSDEDLAVLTSIYTSRVGNMTPSDPSGIFTPSGSGSGYNFGSSVIDQVEAQ